MDGGRGERLEYWNTGILEYWKNSEIPTEGRDQFDEIF
jgi:hypothetical protein